MKNTIIAAFVAAAAAGSFSAPASADSLKIVVKPRVPVVKKVIIVQPRCYDKVTKVVKYSKTIIAKKRVCN